MAVTSVSPGLFPTELLRDTVAAPPAPPDATQNLRVSDTVVFSSAPFRALAELAAAGLRQLATLLPTIEQAVEDRSLEPLAHLAKAAGTAARQVADGHVALLAAGPDRTVAALPGSPLPRVAPHSDAPQTVRALARQIGATLEPVAESHTSDTLRAAARQIGATAMERPSAHTGGLEAEPAQLWIAEAKHLLHRTGDALEQASVMSTLSDPAVMLQTAPSAIALEIAAAQTQIAAAIASLAHAPTPPRRASSGLPLFPLGLLSNRLASATSVMGALILLTIMSLASGLWSLCLGLLGLTATAFWVWRIGRAARGVTLDAAR